MAGIDSSVPNRGSILATAAVALTLFSMSVPVRAASAPVGWLDSVDVEGSTVEVSGWAADPDDRQATAGIHVYVDGSFAKGGSAALHRPDVDRATGLGADHGFSIELGVRDGLHTVCVYAIDRTGDANSRLGCSDVRVGRSAGNRPVGWLDSVTVGESGVRIRGWALDPDSKSPIGVHVYVDGRFRSGFRADNSRPDVNRIWSRGPNHGFNDVFDLDSGWHTVCVYGIDTTGDANALIGCRTVAVGFDGGVVIANNGIVMPVLEKRSDSWRVFTACTNEAIVSFDDGTLVRQADVVIDPGHGGSESGAVANGLVEKSLNLDVARRLEAALERRGYSVLLTRYGDYRLPVRTRGAITQAVGAEVFVSVHHNGGAASRAGHPGTMTLYQHDLPEARRLATLLWEEMYQEALDHPTSWVSTRLTGASTAVRRSGNDFFGVHRFTPGVPSVITEWGYITNPAEARQLKTSSIKNAEAEAIARGIERWFESSESGSGNIGSWVRNTTTGSGGTDGCVDPRIP